MAHYGINGGILGYWEAMGHGGLICGKMTINHLSRQERAGVRGLN